MSRVKWIHNVESLVKVIDELTIYDIETKMGRRNQNGEIGI